MLVGCRRIKIYSFGFAAPEISAGLRSANEFATQHAGHWATRTKQRTCLENKRVAVVIILKQSQTVHALAPNQRSQRTATSL